MNILDKIVAHKRSELGHLPEASVDVESLRAAIAQHGPRRDFIGGLLDSRKGKIGLIAEVKKASPSEGVIREEFDPVAIAKTYQDAGASCLSVLTDREFFQGSLDYLSAIREAVSLPLLRKDFMIDERQLPEAVEHGADAILLIAACLDDQMLGHLHRLATGAGLAALVEVHNEDELDRALAIDARLIGVNNRDLSTFTVDLGATERLAKRLAASGGSEKVLVAESGIHTRADVERLEACGAKAILVGTSLMRQSDIAAKVTELLG
ncbi:MAG TPA: indole-3-glycerol phosphate synthase TrpC [Verrucomicrobiota bacterium]|nr:indole-3-glycerol phosphate synthase TrpC [Verrucomicrobiota bacterium]